MRLDPMASCSDGEVDLGVVEVDKVCWEGVRVVDKAVEEGNVEFVVAVVEGVADDFAAEGSMELAEYDSEQDYSLPAERGVVGVDNPVLQVQLVMVHSNHIPAAAVVVVASTLR